MVEVSDEQMDSIEASFKAAVAIKDERDRLREANRELVEALDTIVGGWTDRFPGAPNVMHDTPEEFRSKMWTWSQQVAAAAIAKHGVK